MVSGCHAIKHMKKFSPRYRQHPDHPLHGYPGPDPATVAICWPIGDFKPFIQCVNGVMQCMPFYARPIEYSGCSLVAEARNRLAHLFLHKFESNLRWSVWLDADIGFTPQDWVYLMEGDDPFVIAPYSKKNFDGTVVDTGFGFTKVHRKVFEAIAQLQTEDGKPRAERFYHPSVPNEIHIDYFPSGALGGMKWCGEDAGFIAWATIAGFPPKLETRCELTHWGIHGFKIARDTST